MPSIEHHTNPTIGQYIGYEEIKLNCDVVRENPGAEERTRLGNM
jgi:hypothetical protein